MRISKIELEYRNLEWFATDKYQKIIRFTSGLYEHDPGFVCASREKKDLLSRFFEKLSSFIEAVLLQNQYPSTSLF